jgi:hypothetical protein
LVENLLREDLSPKKEADALAELVRTPAGPWNRWPRRLDARPGTFREVPVRLKTQGCALKRNEAAPMIFGSFCNVGRQHVFRLTHVRLTLRRTSRNFHWTMS